MGGGLNKLVKNTKEFISIVQGVNGNKLHSTQLVNLLEDSNNQIWIGSAKGLDRYDPITKKIINYKLSSESDTYVNHIVEGSSGLWVGTNTGLFHYNKKLNTFKKHELSLDSNYILAILEHNDTSLWLTTFNGLYKLELTTNKIEKYKKICQLFRQNFATKINYQILYDLHLIPDILLIYV